MDGPYSGLPGTLVELVERGLRTVLPDFVLNLLCGVGGGRKPFLICLVPKHPRRCNENGAIGSEHWQQHLQSSDALVAKYALRLEPDGIWWWLIVFVIAQSTTLAFVDLWLAMMVLAGYGLIYAFLYRQAMHEVLGEIWSAWPRELDLWRLNIPERFRLSTSDRMELRRSSAKVDQRLERLLSMRRRARFGWTYTIPYEKRQFNQSLAANPQRLFYRVALHEFFKGQSTGFLGAGVMRWALYWLAPVWIGFLSLWWPHVLCAITGQCYCDAEKAVLVIAGGVWLFLSLLFLWSQVMHWRAGNWGIDEIDLARLPPVLAAMVTIKIPLQSLITAVWFRQSVVVLNSLWAASYLVSLSVI